MVSGRRNQQPRRGMTGVLGAGQGGQPPETDLAGIQVIGMGGGTRAGTASNGNARQLSARPQLSARSSSGCNGTRPPSGCNGTRNAHGLCHSERYEEPGSQLSVVQSFQACVKVYCTSVAPCYGLPWVRGEETHSTSSGFAALLPSGQRRLLVQAQVVENHTLVQVRRASHTQKYVAQV